MAGKPAGGIRLLGGRKLRRALREVGANMADLSALHKRVASQLLIPARMEAPVLTGALRGSIRPGATRTMATLYSRIIYANPIHWGWPRRNIAPNPFLLRAVARNADQTFTTYSEGLQKIMDKHMARADGTGPS